MKNRFARSLSRPHHRDVVAPAQTGVGGDERKIAVQAMRDQHAIEWIAIVPVERARGFRVGSADRDFRKACRDRRGARRSFERELAGPLLDRDLQE